MSATSAAPAAQPAFDGDSVVKVTDLVAGYIPGVNILNGCSIEARKGELIGIIGPNGAGKSTLLKAMFGLVKVHSGTVIVRGQDLTGLKANKLVTQGVGFVPQTNNVFATLTIEENLQMGMFQRPKAFAERFDFGRAGDAEKDDVGILRHVGRALDLFRAALEEILDRRAITVAHDRERVTFFDKVFRHAVTHEANADKSDAIGHLIEPALTTIDYPGKDVGEIAARNLINHLNGKATIRSTNTIILRSELVIRDSSKKPRTK